MQCPECSGELVIDPTAETEVLVFKPNPGGMPVVALERRACQVAFCSRCDYAVEVM